MDLRRMRTFVTVAELGSVSKAALRLHVAQPSLSRQIAELEQELGLKLFDRVGRRLVLTGEGEQLLGDCNGLLNHATALSERAQSLRRGDKGVLKVAASPQFIDGVLSDFLPRYRRHYPDVEVRLTEAMGGTTVMEMLERGEIHLGQNLIHAAAPDDSRFASHRLEAVDLLAASHPSLKLGKARRVEIGDLKAHPLLLLDKSFIIRRTFDAACRLAGFEPNIRFESRGPHTLLAMAEGGNGVAIVPSALPTRRYSVRIANVTHQGNCLREPLAIFWDRRRQLPRYAAMFRDLLDDHVRSVFPISRPSSGRRRKTVRRHMTV
jgi:DNA-binding transcriptional LysR family regulator